MHPWKSQPLRAGVLGGAGGHSAAGGGLGEGLSRSGPMAGAEGFSSPSLVASATEQQLVARCHWLGLLASGI